MITLLQGEGQEATHWAAHQDFVIATETNSTDEVTICPLCQKTFHGRYQKYNLKRHMSIHAGEKPFQCPYCMHRTNQKYNLQQHLLICRYKAST